MDLRERETFKIPEIARFLGITPQAIHLRLQSGMIHFVRRTSRGGNYLVSRHEVIRLLRKAGREVPGLWTPLRKRVLVIDGCASIRKLMQHAFRDPVLRLKLTTAPTAEDGLVLAATVKPHVIVLNDVFESGRMQGDQAIMLIRNASAFRRIRVIAIGVDRSKLLQAGADIFLTKPFGLEELRAAIYSQAFATSRVRYSGTPLEGIVSDAPCRN